jgi:hypothetical protein
MGAVVAWQAKPGAPVLNMSTPRHGCCFHSCQTGKRNVKEYDA